MSSEPWGSSQRAMKPRQVDEESRKTYTWLEYRSLEAGDPEVPDSGL